jgi:hypothetical protein
MRWITILGLIMVLSACSNVQQQLSMELDPTVTQEVVDDERSYSIDLPDLGQAPELENEVWLNTDQPLRLSELKDRVILLDMWTFG